MKTLIALRGTANQGKSASIKEAYLLLKQAYPNAIVEEIWISVDITIAITINGAKVGIESQGDPNSRLFPSLKHFAKIGCNVIICATRTRGGTVDFVDTLKKQYSIQWLNKSGTSPRGRAAANSATANDIFTRVKLALD